MNKLVIMLFLIMLSIMGCGQDKPVPSPPTEPQIDPEHVASEVGMQEPQLPGALLVLIDNYYKARPQSGLDKADWVYEIMAEGGITRYLALYYQEKAEKIGPIRSARYYFVQVAKGHDAPLAHAGGNQNALELISTLKIKDLDEIYNSGGYFWRDSKRKPPHNLYTSSDLLVKGAKARGLALAPPSLQPRGQLAPGEVQQGDIVLDYSNGKNLYKVTWRYNGKYYERDINGTPHIMEDGAFIKADNIIVMTAKTRDVWKEELESEIILLGKGEARFFIEGKVVYGSWSKPTVQAPLSFLDEAGLLVNIREGKTWIQVLPDWSSLS